MGTLCGAEVFIYIDWSLNVFSLQYKSSFERDLTVFTLRLPRFPFALLLCTLSQHLPAFQALISFIYSTYWGFINLSTLKAHKCTCRNKFRKPFFPSSPYNSTYWLACLTDYQVACQGQTIHPHKNETEKMRRRERGEDQVGNESEKRLNFTAVEWKGKVHLCAPHTSVLAHAVSCNWYVLMLVFPETWLYPELCCIWLIKAKYNFLFWDLKEINTFQNGHNNQNSC